MTAVYEYDPKTCITAGELRTAGCDIQEDVPDCAWVPRTSLKLDLDPSETSIDGKELRIKGHLTSSEPFRWIEVSGTVEDDL